MIDHARRAVRSRLTIAARWTRRCVVLLPQNDSRSTHPRAGPARSITPTRVPNLRSSPVVVQRLQPLSGDFLEQPDLRYLGPLGAISQLRDPHEVVPIRRPARVELERLGLLVDRAPADL